MADRVGERLGGATICGRDDRFAIEGAAEMLGRGADRAGRGADKAERGATDTAGRGDGDRDAALDREGAAELRDGCLWMDVGRGAEKLRGWTRLELGLEDRLGWTMGERETLERDRSRAARSPPRRATAPKTPTQRWRFR